MSKRILIKVAVVALLALTLLVPLQMIRGLIESRADEYEKAKQEMGDSWTGAQAIFGPVLRFQAHPTRESQPVPAQYLLPDRVAVDASLTTQIRKRGQHSIPVYVTRLLLSGTFDPAGLSSPGEATLAISVSDNRGIVKRPTVRWNGEPVLVVAGSGLPGLHSGVSSNLGRLEPTGRPVEFEIEIDLRGMERLSFSPLGSDTHVRLSANWPHPSFMGRFPPTNYEIRQDGFDAEWDVSELAVDRGQILNSLAEGHAGLLGHNSFGATLIIPIDIYRQTTRSVKYGSLFIVVTFTAFFLVETLRKLTLHPMQYLLVGLALVIFFLLLLSLSEHLAFGLAYLIASAACVSLISVYLSSVLGGLSQSLAAVGLLGTLYATLYTILTAEDLALLMGSVLLFILLALVMTITRRVDWYGLTRQITANSE